MPVLAAAGLAILATTSLAQEPSTRGDKAREVLGLLDAELVHVDLPQPGNNHLLVALQGQSLEGVLVLDPRSPRSPSYQLLVQRADGSTSISSSQAPRTFRGTLSNWPGSLVSASLSDEGLFARILLPDGRSLWLEPLHGRLPDASAVEYVLYEDGDVAPSSKTCAVPVTALSTDGTGGAAPESGGGDGSSSAAGALKVAELACEADYEYFLDYGSVAAVEARIHAVVDAINLQYELEVGITHAITSILVQTSSSQPYTMTDPQGLLYQFRDYWNANHGGVVRDVAHLFTGKQLNGSVIGIAYLGVICNSTFGYGVSQSDFSSNFASVTDLTAHELGHNWNAGHCTCTSYTMNPYITSANTFNPVGTIPAIEAFRDSRSCLDDAGGPPPPPPGDPEINLTTAESTSAGTLSAGSHLTTHEQDGVSEVVTEVSNGGKPSKRKSQMSHRWTFDVLAGTGYTFFLDAHHSANAEGDDFEFSYSLDGSSYVPMLTVTKTSGDNSLASFSFQEDVSGTLYVRAEDTDRTVGNGSKDSLHVDHMFVHTEIDGVDTTPPSAPTNLGGSAGDGSNSLDWDDNGEADLAGYNVQRATSAGGPFVQVNLAPLADSDWTDPGLTNGTTYHYTTTAVDLDGNESVASSSIKLTPGAGGGGASSCHVDSILVTAANLGGGRKKGRADVVIVDDLGDPVAGAVVTGTFSGDLSEVLSVTSDAQGALIFLTSEAKKGGLDLTFCVDDVTHASLNYAPADNVETCDVR